MQDEKLICKDCGKEFVWTVGEQEFYKSRGLESKPARCKECRDARKNKFNKRPRREEN